MKNYKFIFICFISVFCFCIALQKFELIVHGLPMGGLSWTQILMKFPVFFIISSVMTFLFYKFFKQLEQQQEMKINASKKISDNKYRYCSPAETLECRICGYSNIDFPWGKNGKSPSYQICPCCGSQFGKDDVTPKDIKEKRKEWLNKGSKWFEKNKKPNNWNLNLQMNNIPVVADIH